MLNGELLRTSLELVLERQPEITPRFYEILFARYPQVQPLFGLNSSERQAKMLQEAIVAVVDHVDDATWLASTLGGMGRQHVGYGVRPEMYAYVGECLLATLAEIAGSAWTPAVERAWTDAFGAIRDLMLAGAAAESGTAATDEGSATDPG
jgi:hemoglobin-like flavoprotein